jgi:putative glycosyltransferase (TIGR04372 family)
MGVPPGHSFVCFSARDDRYLEELHPVKDWGYHRYRNSDIRNYLSAMEELAAGGYWVFRMGALVNRPISSAHHRVIDYASLHRSDFMDVFLLSHCRFFVGDTAGIIAFPLTFNTPYVKVNCVPLNSLARNANAIFIPKTYREKSTGKTLTFSEIFRLGADMWYLSEQYERAGVEAVENTAEEIMEAVTEMRLRLDGKWRATEEDEMLQRKFRSLIPDDNELKGFVSRIGAAFISKNRHLME